MFVDIYFFIFRLLYVCKPFVESAEMFGFNYFIFCYMICNYSYSFIEILK